VNHGRTHARTHARTDGQRHGRTTRKHIASAGAYRRRRLNNDDNNVCVCVCVCAADIDECLDPGSCDTTTTCINTYGSYKCVCAHGYKRWNGACIGNYYYYYYYYSLLGN